jgi:hypothetical protein
MKERGSPNRWHYPVILRRSATQLKLPRSRRFPYPVAVIKIRINSWHCPSWTKAVRMT